MGGFGKKFELEKAKAIADSVTKRLIAKKIEVCGSIRRCKAKVGDVDIVVVPGALDEFYASIDRILNEEKGHGLVYGQKNIQFVLNDGFKVDIIVCDDDTFESGKLYFTGSKWFNIRCRSKAKKLGYRLNRYGLWDINGNRIANTEEDILLKIGMESYINPKVRRN